MSERDAVGGSGPEGSQHWDVVIVGAGLSGIGAAHRLREQSPSSTFTILEARDRIGGTWEDRKSVV